MQGPVFDPCHSFNLISCIRNPSHIGYRLGYGIGSSSELMTFNSSAFQPQLFLALGLCSGTAAFGKVTGDRVHFLSCN